jgi:succinate-semialdehyde dehydrogenase / glutarate-semialdehyde dehydrogenase
MARSPLNTAMPARRVCANRILVQDGVCDAFTKRLAETAGAMKVADGFEPGAVIGPLIDMKAVEKIEAHIAGKTVGVRNTRCHCEERSDEAIWVGSGLPTRDCFAPLAMTLVTTDMVITKEETFGPVAPLYHFESEADAVKMAKTPPP